MEDDCLLMMVVYEGDGLWKVTDTLASSGWPYAEEWIKEGSES